jgi:hypothetical protein
MMIWRGVGGFFAAALGAQTEKLDQLMMWLAEEAVIDARGEPVTAGPGFWAKLMNMGSRCYELVAHANGGDYRLASLWVRRGLPACRYEPLSVVIQQGSRDSRYVDGILLITRFSLPPRCDDLGGM